MTTKRTPYPVLKANQRAIDAAKPKGGKRTIYAIEGHPGLQLDVAPNGAASWRVIAHIGRGRQGRRQRKITIGPVKVFTLSAAATRAQRILQGAKSGTMGSAAGLTFHDLFERWHAWASGQQRPSTHAAARALYERLLRDRLGGLKLPLERQDVLNALDDIAKAKAGRKRLGTPIQANRALTIVSSVCSYALDEGLITAHPAMRIRKRVKEQPRARPYSEAELRTIWRGAKEMNPAHRDAIRLLLLLGLRRSEVVEAERGELDLTAGLLSIRAQRRKGWRVVKPPLPNVVPLSPEAQAIFKSAIERSRDSRYVFPNRNMGPDRPMLATRLSSVFAELMRDLEIPDAHLHDIRHTVKTGMTRIGVPRFIADRVQDHADGTTASQYDHNTYEKEKRDALERWERELLRIVGEK